MSSTGEEPTLGDVIKTEKDQKQSSDDEIRKHYSPQQLAEETSSGLSTIYDLLRRGLIPHTRFGHKYIIPGAYVRQLREGATEDVA